MLIKRTVLSQAIKIACSGLVAGSFAVGGVAMAAEEEPVALEKEAVTGSHIKRVDVEGPSPVLVIEREDIESTGASTVAEVLRNLTSNTGPSFDEKFTNSFAPGAAGVSLRGLGQNATLVLVNSRRVANYGFSQNINESFVDLNSIPLGAVERIEVLKDGASAIYGSDAIAGVINVILRDDYEGSEVSVSYGSTDKSDGEETQVNFLAGVNNASSNITFNLNYFDRGEVWLKDRDFSESADHTNQGGPNDGYDFSSSTYPTANVRAATGEWLAINGFYDYNPWITMIPSTTRLSGLVNFNQEITPDINLFTEVSYNSSETDQQAAPTPLFGDLDDVLVAADTPFNTYGVDVYTRWRMEEFGPRSNHLETDAYRVLAGFEGTTMGWDWSVGALHSESKTHNEGKNYVSAPALQDAIADGTINPFGTSANDPDVIDTIRLRTNRKAKSELTSYDGNVSSEIYELPAGMLGFAAGIEYREESVKDTPDPLGEKGLIIGSGGTSSKGDRDLTSLYAEFSVPIIDTLEAQLAVRYEDYSDFGSTTNPKIALRWQPTEWLMMRGSYNTGFRAPSLVELHLGESLSYPFLVDTTRCAITGLDIDCGGSQYKTYFTGNPDLDPEESENWYFGLVVEPIEDLTLGADYWSYEHTDRIDANTQYILDNEASFPGRVVRTAPAFPGDPGAILYIDDSFLNISEQETDGWDFDFRYSFETGGWGEWQLRGTATYVNSFKRRAAPGEPMEELSGTYNRPDWRANFGVAWTRNDHNVTLTGNYIGEYEHYYTDYNDEVVDMDDMLWWDVQYMYTGFDSVELRVGADNLFDEEPPFSNSETEGYDFSVHNPLGRFIYARLKYMF